MTYHLNLSLNKMERYQGLEDVVRIRVPKNEASPKFRHLALNSEGIRYLNEATHVINHELSAQDELKLLIIAHLIECETIHNDIQSSSSLSFSSNSSS